MVIPVAVLQSRLMLGIKVQTWRVEGIPQASHRKRVPCHCSACKLSGRLKLGGSRFETPTPKVTRAKWTGGTFFASTKPRVQIPVPQKKRFAAKFQAPDNNILWIHLGNI
jgi:hypothetical protein